MLAAANNFGLSFGLEILGLAIVVALIWRYVAPLLNRQMARRRETIAAQLAAGAEARAAAEELVSERRAALEAARADAAEVVAQARRSAEYLVDDGIRRAEEEYGRIVARAEHAVEAARARMRETVLSELGAAVAAATEVVVRAELDLTAHRRLIAEAIDATAAEQSGAVA